MWFLKEWGFDFLLLAAGEQLLFFMLERANRIIGTVRMAETTVMNCNIPSVDILSPCLN